ncbi:guanylate kinase [Sporolactobacillus terrae]|nr:guanylate kinase [Sporolactobacillus terrae]QAA22297.1 guanylate kinase [Sporolactobacillus terrae]QAA25272.1 guanylate kinase [Sporolactobacillus terrae]UAK17086.1 guanylate kinase [Sporolactobacillus terrae]BBN98611.1 guanylate kinase [Sporolactobacillus terrae]
MSFKEKGLLVVLSGPSGVGKGTVCRTLRERGTQLNYSISATTRKPREGEIDGVHYFFKTREQFQKMIEQEKLLEWAEYVGNCYGTPVDYVHKMIESGQDVILEIEVQGALQVKKKFPEALFIFLAPPNLDELKSRIIGRGTETAELIESRMNVAKSEMELMQNYNYVVENDQVQKACDRIEAIVLAEHCRVDRLIEKYMNKEGVDGK